MSIESDIRAALLTMDAVTALVGSGASARIYPDSWPETATWPAVLIELDIEEPANTLDGKGGLVFADVTITSRATTRLGSRALAEAIRVNGTNPGTGLAGYSGEFKSVLDATETADVPYEEASDQYHYDTLQTYFVSWPETT